MFKYSALHLSVCFFMLHGILYYLYPGQHYLLGGNGWLQYLKYFFLLPLLIYSLFHLPNLERNAVWYSVLFCFLILSIVDFYYWYSDFNLLLLQIILTFTSFISSRFISNLIGNIKIIRFYYLILSLLVVVALSVEFIYDIFGDIYSKSGFRAAGPFLNPNNTGLVMVFLSFLYQRVEKSKCLLFFSFFCTIYTIILTGSKTALLIYCIVLFFSFNNKKRVSLCLAGFIFLLTYLFFKGVFSADANFRDFSLESAYIRLNSISTLFGSYGNDIIGMLFGISNISLVDNAYLDTLFSSGLLIALLIISVQFLSFYKSVAAKNKLLLYSNVMLLLMMITTNITRLWPLGYIFWVVVSLSLLTENLKETKVKSYIKTGEKNV